MADNKSCEENILYQCIKCERHKVIENGTDGSTCDYCNGYLNALGFTNLSTSKERTSLGELHVDIDCSNALTGLKAIQREARKTSKELKEVESLMNDKYLVIQINELGDVPTVIYKGQEISGKEFINLQWTTKSEVPGSTDLIVDYFEKDDSGIKSKSIREGART